MSLPIAPGVVIPDEALSEAFVRGAGPGGQNVNKVATAVELRLDVSRAGLADDVRARLCEQQAGRLTTDGTLVIVAREHRTQGLNREAARARLAAMIRTALVRPKRRRATRVTAAARARRLESKARRARVKAGRGRTSGEE